MSAVDFEARPAFFGAACFGKPATPPRVRPLRANPFGVRPPAAVRLSPGSPSRPPGRTRLSEAQAVPSPRSPPASRGVVASVPARIPTANTTVAATYCLLRPATASRVRAWLLVCRTGVSPVSPRSCPPPLRCRAAVSAANSEALTALFAPACSASRPLRSPGFGLGANPGRSAAAQLPPFRQSSPDPTPGPERGTTRDGLDKTSPMKSQ